MYFCTRGASQLFWKVLVLQLCLSDPIDRDLGLSVNLMLSSFTPKCQHCFALTVCVRITNDCIILIVRACARACVRACVCVKGCFALTACVCVCVQNQREVTLAGFRSGKFPVLVATDVAARGLDISGVELVVQCEPPKDPETYIHR